MFFPLPLVIQGNLALERAKQRYDTYPACTGTSPFCFLLWKFSILCILIFTSRPWGNCQNVIGNSISFATGLATTLALLGVAASFAGKAYGQIGRGLPVRSLGGVQAYLAGLTFVLAEDASPAVLQCLLRCLGMSRLHQGSTGRGSLLLTYTTGYVARLLLAASFAGSLQMIGLIKPTSGSAYVEGLDIWTEMNRIYTSMGVCPQHDFPWGILTGREHLLFYGRLKNLKGSSSVQVSLIFLEVIVGHHNNTNQYSKHIKKSLYLGVEESLKSVNLFHGGVADKQAGKYSGGIKRRLSVAISLIGVY